MKELERWWHWFDTEHPTIARAWSLLYRLTAVEREALDQAAIQIQARRAGRRLLIHVLATNPIAEMVLRTQLQAFPKAMRRLSLALCAQLEELETAVPSEPTRDLVPHQDLAPNQAPRSAQDQVDLVKKQADRVMETRAYLAPRVPVFSAKFLERYYFSPHNIVKVDL